MVTSQLDIREVHINAHDEFHPHPQVQVIICSCSSHNTSEEVHILPSPIHTPVITINNNSLPTLRHFLTNLLPFNTPIFQHKYIQNNLHLLHQARHKLHTLPISFLPKARKYLLKPWLIPALLLRSQTKIQNALGIEPEVHSNSVYDFIGLMSFRLWFNIWAVVVWVLIRKFLEVFGVYFEMDLGVREERMRFGGAVGGERVGCGKEEGGFGASVGEEEGVDAVADEGESLGMVEDAWVPVKKSRLAMASGSIDGWQRIC